MLTLTAQIGGERKSWRLEKAPLGIGRSSKNAIHLPDGTVSKDHAELLREGERWMVRDLGSRNGTRVNGVEASQPLAFQDGDLLEVGKVVLQVSRGDPPTLESGRSTHSSSVRLRVEEVLGRSTAGGPDAARMVHLLAEAGRLLVLPRPLGETCEEILHLVEKAVPANRLILLLREKEGTPPVQVAARYRGGSARQPLAMSKTILDGVLEENTAMLIVDTAADERFRMQQSIVAHSIRSAMAVPLFDNDRVLGVLYVDSNDPLSTYGQDQLEILTLLGNMAAVKITNSRLLEAEQARARMAQELASASRIQRSLLPAVPPIPGFDCHARIVPCFEVAGDLYDFHVKRNGRVVFTVADVSGKGLGASLLMSSVMTSSRVLYDDCDGPAPLASRLNSVMNRSVEPGHFVTAFFGELDPASGRLRYVNAGHNPPMLLRRGGLEELEPNGIPISVLPDFAYSEESVELVPGDVLAVFSDGIPEAKRGDEFFDTQRLGQSLRAHAHEDSLETAADQVLRSVDEFLEGAPRTDDITLVLLRRR